MSARGPYWHNTNNYAVDVWTEANTTDQNLGQYLGRDLKEES